MRKYETIYILNPNTSIEDTRRITTTIVDHIGRGGGKVARIDDWGIKRLAYPIKKFSRGHYILVEYAGDGPIVREIERNLKISEWALKYQTVKIADRANLDEIGAFNVEEVKFHGPQEVGARESAGGDEGAPAPAAKAAAAEDEEASEETGGEAAAGEDAEGDED